MVTLTPAARRIGSAMVAGWGALRSPLARGTRRRRQETTLPDLVDQIARLGEELHAIGQELRRANEIQVHRLLTEQLDRAIDDPTLAAALSTLNGISEHKRRQMLFANREYATILLSHRTGTIDWSELLGNLRVLCRNEIFAEYWERTVEHRRSLAVGSLERQVGEAVDTLMEELADDPEEWWIVGPSPEPPGD
ncbi:DUF6082 family protein [Streptomyces sp. NPDC085900]|uniref:DUF6082 family protein n=1 Tax=Streptomyces sp. NPDC085900 TaxID=3365737 RepID=UPI0037D2782B